MERKEFGRATIRYRISNPMLNEDDVCTEDLDAEQVKKILENIPISDEDRQKTLKALFPKE